MELSIFLMIRRNKGVNNDDNNKEAQQTTNHDDNEGKDVTPRWFRILECVFSLICVPVLSGTRTLLYGSSFMMMMM